MSSSEPAPSSWGEWQPIETAPRDGTAILIWQPNNTRRKEWQSWPAAGGPPVGPVHYYDDDRYAVGYWRPWSNGGWGNRNSSRVEPTHWMPLPSPPDEVDAASPGAAIGAPRGFSMSFAGAGALLDGLRMWFRHAGLSRRWSFEWPERSGYAHGELAELVEAVRGKRGDIVDEAADVLLTSLMGLVPPHIPMADVLMAASKKTERIAAGTCGVDGPASPTVEAPHA